MLISEQTSNAIDEAVGMYFDLNRTFDRAVSYMTNIWAMPNAANIIHHHLAHLFPLLADKLTEIKDRYNLPSVYPQTHEDSRIYANLKDMMDELLRECADGYQVISMVNKVAEENGDFMVHADLITIMQYHNEVMGQVITLDDKANQLSTEFDEYDRHIDSWSIDGIPSVMNPTGEDD